MFLTEGAVGAMAIWHEGRDIFRIGKKPVSLSKDCGEESSRRAKGLRCAKVRPVRAVEHFKESLLYLKSNPLSLKGFRKGDNIMRLIF